MARSQCRPRGSWFRVDLAEAIIESCDVFFYTTGIKTGIDLLSTESSLFGLGNITGIDLPGEKRGIMPSREWKRINADRTGLMVTPSI